jgi:hypothetical protein
MANLTSTNGLTPGDEKALQDALEGLAPLMERLFLFGREATEIMSIAAKLKDRLNPPTPEALVTEANRLIAAGMPIIESRRRSAEECERGRELVAARSRDARDRMHAEQAALVEKVKARKLVQSRASAAAVNEALSEAFGND